AYSSIAHAGYLLVAVAVGAEAGAAALLVYLVAYALTTLAAFGLLAALGRDGERDVRIDDLAGLAQRRPWLALALAVCMLSLLGFPGTAGFIGKWYILTAAADAGRLLLATVLVLTTVVSAGYYLPVIMAVYMKPEPFEQAHAGVRLGRLGGLVVAASVAGLLFFGVRPNRLLDLAKATGEGLHPAPVPAASATAGGLAVDVGELPTPALYFATHTLDVDGGVQVTGSHNPPEFNGFKLVLGPEPVYGAEIQGLRRLIEEGRTPARKGGRRIEDRTVLPRYRDAIVERNGPLPRKVKVVVDCGNGVSSLIAVDTLRRLGAEVVPLCCESDGRFPNHHPDPTVLDNLRDLQAAVRRERSELGIAFDGDGDRIGAVDEQGRPVFGDQLLVLLGRDVAHRLGRGGRGQPVIFDVKCSEVLPRELARVGLEPVMWKTGHSLIKQKMKETNAPLAGEMSGHMFFGG